MKRHTRVRVALATGATLFATVTAAYMTASAQATTHSAASTSAKPTKQQIASLFDKWNAALATGDPERVTALYASDAVLLPTVSAKIRTNHAEIADYFEHFLQKKPVGKKVQTIVEVFDRNNAIDTGLYRFTLTAVDGTKTDIDARYTYVYEKRGGKWLIVNHHSSVLPAEG